MVIGLRDPEKQLPIKFQMKSLGNCFPGRDSINFIQSLGRTEAPLPTKSLIKFTIFEDLSQLVK